MSVPAEDRAKEIKGLELGSDKLPVERVLGVEWCIDSDTFRIDLKDKLCTHRGILATISSIFDHPCWKAHTSRDLSRKLL